LVAITAPGASTYLDKNLKADEGYVYVLRPVNNFGAAELSNEAMVPELDVVPPTTPANLTAVTVDKTFVELDWDDATDETGVSSYDVYVNNVKKYSVSESSITADSLAENTAYQFTVKALDAAGNTSPFSNTVTVTTLFTPDTEAPSVPINLKVVKTDVTAIELDWDNATDNKAVTGYEIYVNGVAAYTSVASNLVANNLQANTTYSFSVKAIDAAGNSSALSNEVTDKTREPLDVTAPSVPGNLKAVTITTTSVTLDWDDATDNKAVTGYDIYVNGVKKYTTVATTIVADNLTPNTNYSFTVKSVDAAGNSSAFTPAVAAKTLQVAPPADVTAPSVPANLKVTTITTTSVTLDWDNATDNVGVTSYDVYVDGLKKYTTAASNIIANNLASNTSYTFTVKALDAAGNSSVFSGAVSAKTLTPPPPPDVTAPSIPANLSVPSITTTSIELDWDNATDNIGVTGYDVYVNGVKKYSAITSNIIANNLASNTSYAFTVKALDAAGNSSAASNAVTAKTLAPAPPADKTAPTSPANLKVISVTSSTVQLDWDNATDNVGVTGYEVYVNGVKKYTSTASTIVANNLAANTSYSFTVKAVDAAGNISGTSNAVTGKTAQAGDLTAPTAPGSLKVIYTTRTSVELAWDKSTDNVGVTRYDVYVNGVKTFNTTGTTIVATGLTAYVTYKFTVKAADQAGNISQSSNQVAAIPMLTGLKYKYYEGAWSSLPNFNNLTPVKTGVTPDIDLNERRTGVNDNYGFVWEGFIKINTPGVYTFETRSDDGSKFYFNKTYSPTAVANVNNDGMHEEKSVSTTINITKAGVYPIAVTFFERTGEGKMKLYWKGPGISRQEVPVSAFSDATTGYGALLQALLAYFNASNTEDNSSNSRYTNSDNNDSNWDWKGWNNSNQAAAGLTVVEENAAQAPVVAPLQITKAYPSPFVDVVNIEFTNNSSESKVTVEVFDMYGKMMHSQHFGSTPSGKSRLVVNLDHKKLPAGLYLIRLNVDGKPSPAIRLMKANK
jgi:chitodextrinase